MFFTTHPLIMPSISSFGLNNAFAFAIVMLIAGSPIYKSPIYTLAEHLSRALLRCSARVYIGLL